LFNPQLEFAPVDRSASIWLLTLWQALAQDKASERIFSWRMNVPTGEFLTAAQNSPRRTKFEVARRAGPIK
jgi:hypothetical protein